MDEARGWILAIVGLIGGFILVDYLARNDLLIIVSIAFTIFIGVIGVVLIWGILKEGLVESLFMVGPVRSHRGVPYLDSSKRN